MYVVKERIFTRTNILGSFESFAAAEAHVRNYFRIVCFEPDADYPGCADFYSEEGTVGSIEPERED